MNKKLVSVFLAASTLIWGVGIATLPLANAQTTTASLEAQIASLLAQIQQLQAQLKSAQGGSSAVTTSYDFTRDLTVGSQGADVKALQEFLNANGAQVAASGAGSPGHETDYFGPLTKAALAKYQAAHGIKPAAGYFGPITRSYIASLSVGTSTGTGTGTSTGTGTGTTTPPATGLSVSLSPENPGAGSLISSSNGQTAAARIPVLAINLTASNAGAVTVNEIKVHKQGVLSDSSIAGAYLVQNGQVVYQYNSLNQGVIDFSGMDLTVPAGQTVTLQVAIDPSTGLSAGNTVSFSVNSASDISAFDSSNNAITPSGSFPLNGNTFTVTTVSNPSLAGVTISSSSIATQVTAGSQNNIVGAWTFNVQNSMVYLKGIKFTVIGSANNSDLRNVKLLVNGTQVGQTLSSVPQNGFAYFDLSSNPGSLNTGNNNVQIEADVMGSPSKNFQFEILNSYDVLAVDSQYGVPVSVTNSGGTGTQVSIEKGQITVSQDSTTPTGNIAVGQSGVTLAKFDIYAAGEPVKVKYLGFTLSFTGLNTASDTALSQVVKNVQLTDDAGGQVGTTINTPPSSSASSCDNVPANSYPANASWPAATSSVSLTYADCFGTAASPINYIVPANTTRVLSLKADIQPTANFQTVTAALLAESNNLQGLISSQVNSSAGTQGSSLSLQSSLLTVAKNSSYGNQVITPNTLGAKIGSYAFSASSASGVQLNTVSIKVGGSNNSNDIANIKLMVGGTQFGSTQGVVADGGTYTFTGPAFTVPAGGTTNVDVYADILSSGQAMTPATSITGCSGTSVVSYSAISCGSTAVDGQNLTVATSGTKMAISLDSTAPAATQLVMGSKGNTLAVYSFEETQNIENVKVTDLTIKQNTASGNQSAYEWNNASGLALYNGSTLLGTSGAAVKVTGGYTYDFHFSTPVIIPQANSARLTLKGDVATYASGGATDNSTSTFSVSSVTALGASSNLPTSVTGTATGNVMTVLRSTLTASGVSVSGLPAAAPDQQIGTLNLAANTAGDVMPNTIKITVSGNAYTYGTSSLMNSLVLKHNGTNITLTGLATATVSGNTVTWTFATSTNPLKITAGSTYELDLFADPSTVPAQANTSLSLTAAIQNPTDLSYYDGTSGSPALVTLPATQPSIIISSLQSGNGSQL